MKAVRSHDYRIDGYGNVKFIKVDIGNGRFDFQGFLEARRSRKRNPDWMAARTRKANGKARALFLQKGLLPGRRAP